MLSTLYTAFLFLENTRPNSWITFSVLYTSESIISIHFSFFWR